MENDDLVRRITYAFAADDRKTHKKHAESRDMMLAILAAHPEVFENPTPVNLSLIRGAAERCANIGPFEKSVELYRKLVTDSNSARDYAKFSEVLAQCDYLDEAIAALKKAMALDPVAYDTEANRETVSMIEAV